MIIPHANLYTYRLFSRESPMEIQVNKTKEVVEYWNTVKDTPVVKLEGNESLDSLLNSIIQEGNETQITLETYISLYEKYDKSISGDLMFNLVDNLISKLKMAEALFALNNYMYLDT
jgi:hypothetical protein